MSAAKFIEANPDAPLVHIAKKKSERRKARRRTKRVNKLYIGLGSVGRYICVSLRAHSANFCREAIFLSTLSRGTVLPCAFYGHFDKETRTFSASRSRLQRHERSDHKLGRRGRPQTGWRVVMERQSITTRATAAARSCRRTRRHRSVHEPHARQRGASGR